MKLVIEISDDNFRLCPDYYQGDLVVSQILHAVKHGIPMESEVAEMLNSGVSVWNSCSLPNNDESLRKEYEYQRSGRTEEEYPYSEYLENQLFKAEDEIEYWESRKIDILAEMNKL